VGQRVPKHTIESLDDPALAPYRDLKWSNLTRWSGRFIAEGDKVVLRLLASGFGVESVLAAESFVPQVLPLLQSRPETRLLVAADDLVPRIVGFNFHRGLLACGIRRPNPTLAELCPAAERSARIVVCPDVQGPDNLGQIIRTSCALGVDGVIVGPRAGDPFSRRVLRVSMGAAFSVPIYESTSHVGDLTQLRTQQAIELVATVLDDSATPLGSFQCPLRAAILLGSEGHGLDRELVELCDGRITIPMQRGTDSLNVAVAAGIVLNHCAAMVIDADPLHD
jgi:tRNA G18 (ribose-2'-O)-methylase SpoU